MQACPFRLLVYISAHITALVEHGVGAILSDLHPDLGAVSTGVRDAPFITRAFLHITINLALCVNFKARTVGLHLSLTLMKVKAGLFSLTVWFRMLVHMTGFVRKPASSSFLTGL